MKIFLSDLNNDMAMELKRFLEKENHEVLNNPGGDLSREENAESLAGEIKAAGGLDALILTARETPRSLMETMDIGVFRKAFDANAKAAFFLIKHLGALMAEQGGGAVVILSSIHSEKPTGVSAAFSCSMGALQMLGRESALQLGRRGVHTVMVETGPLPGDEETFDSLLTPIYDGHVNNIPRKTALAYDELFGVVLNAVRSPALNGADIRVDGGFTLHYLDR